MVHEESTAEDQGSDVAQIKPHLSGQGTVRIDQVRCKHLRYQAQ